MVDIQLYADTLPILYFQRNKIVLIGPFILQ